MIVSVTVVRVIESNDTATTAQATSPTAAVVEPVAVVMQGGPNNAAAGWAYVNDRHGVAVSVNYGIASGRYSVMVTPATASGNANGSTSIGTVDVVDGRGSWTGRSDDALRAGSRIALVDATGTEVCHGTVPVAG
jgi:hypothetical protein